MLGLRDLKRALHIWRLCSPTNDSERGREQLLFMVGWHHHPDVVDRADRQ
jgi:hypothetical protein